MPSQIKGEPSNVNATDETPAVAQPTEKPVTVKEQKQPTSGKKALKKDQAKPKASAGGAVNTYIVK